MLVIPAEMATMVAQVMMVNVVDQAEMPMIAMSNCQFHHSANVKLFLDHVAPLVNLVTQVTMVMLETLEAMAHLAILADLDPLVSVEMMDCLVNLVVLVPPVWSKVAAASLLQANRANPAAPEIQVVLVVQAIPDEMVALVMPVNQVILDPVALQAAQEIMEVLEKMVVLALEEHAISAHQLAWLLDIKQPG